MPYPFHPEPWSHFFDIPSYIPERDGTLEDYLREHDGSSSTPLFQGYSWFETLKKHGYLIPGSIIRIMYNLVRGDEHYEVTQNYQLQGLLNGAHAGHEGIHQPQDLPDDPNLPWEATHLQLPRQRS